MKLVNLCPHEIVVVRNGEEPLVLPAASNPLRVNIEEVEIGQVQNIPILKTEFKELEFLPEPQEGVFYVVSTIVRQMLPERTDLISPARLARNEKGEITACTAFACNIKQEETK